MRQVSRVNPPMGEPIFCLVSNLQMRAFFDEPRHPAGFHALIFNINVFNNPHKLARLSCMLAMADWDFLAYFSEINAFLYNSRIDFKRLDFVREQGGIRFKNGAYTQVREYFESDRNAAIGQKMTV